MSEQETELTGAETLEFKPTDPDFKVGTLSEGHELYREGYEYVGLCRCTYFSAGWPTEEQALMRIEAHNNEHKTGELMPDKSEVEALTPDKFTVEVSVGEPTGPIGWDEI